MQAISHLRMKLTGLGIRNLPIFPNTSLESALWADGNICRNADHLADERLRIAYGLAVDSAGDVFIADTGNFRVVELPKTATGYGPQTTLPVSGLYHSRWGCRGQCRGCVHRGLLSITRCWNCRRQRQATGRRQLCRSTAMSGPTAELPWTVLGTCSSPTLATTVCWNCHGKRRATGRRRPCRPAT